MSVDNFKHFVLRNKELLMFLVGFGAMHYGWYNLQRNSTLNKALATSHEKEMLNVSSILFLNFLNIVKRYTYN